LFETFRSDRNNGYRPNNVYAATCRATCTKSALPDRKTISFNWADQSMPTSTRRVIRPLVGSSPTLAAETTTLL
jgi:hypothetical protein